ncbi:hypothetical protein K488DRAFT_83851 [Vararia minispora EC-137]|uniref:Uncharacterized protein n=1 Tax=Vararia minispora EC-137 TaxID=1314806 RepID=A0ACB8QRP8_9AGAM|nr:hypothetical protein K488DRAFT_83851 [Vararia minispora EC-137]
MRIGSEIRLTLLNWFVKIALNRTTKAFFLLSVLFCFAQGIIQSFLYSVDTRWHGFTSSVVSFADIDGKIFLQYTLHDTWEICSHSPVAGGVPDACVPFYTAGEPASIPPGFRRDNSDNNAARTCLSGAELTGLSLSGVPNSNGTATITLVQQRPPGQECKLDTVCTRTILYPNEKLRQAIREDASLIALQFWLLGVAIFAIISESIPHLIALAFARLLSVGWSSYTIWRTLSLGSRIAKLIGNPGTPCQLGVFPPYISQRVAFQIADVVLHSVAFVWTLILSWNLIQVYLRTTFRRIGPPKAIVVIYRYFTTVLVGLQLSAFFLVVAIGLWIDQLMNSALKNISSHTKVYQAASISTVLLLIPWIAMGWFAVRHEMRRPMIAFLATSGLFISMWSLMFYSQVYRFSFIDWPFFGCLTCTSFVVMIVSVVFGVICWRNFGGGLAHYLHADNALRSSSFEPELFVHEAEKAGTSASRADRRIILKLDIDSLSSSDELPPYKSSIESFALDSKGDGRL